MKEWLLDTNRLARASQYIAVALLPLPLVCVVLKLWRADLRVPLHYNGDALVHLLFIKGIVENGWYWQNPFVGMPTGLKMYDLPAVDNSDAVILWLISFFSSNAIVVLNIFYLLTFPLIAVSSFYVFRRFNFSFVTSLCCSLLYTFLPYHFMRDESHLFLSAYYFIPLVVMVMLWTASEKFFDHVEGQKPKFKPRGGKFILSVVICVVMGSKGVYYPFFSCFLLLIAGLSGSINRRTLRPLAVAVILIVVTTTTLVVNFSPTFLNSYRHGNVGVAERNLAGPEIYGLKISQLVLPVTGHRIDYLRAKKDFYNKFTNMTENDAASLGLIGTIGFLALIVVLFYRRRDNALLAELSVLNLFAVMLGTIGGFGSLFALLVSPSIRSYNRISVFIAFFALFAVAVGADYAYRRLKTKRARIVFCVVAGVVALGGILDQTTNGFVPQYAWIKAEFRSDEEFVHNIEASLPPGAMIFQLPYVTFPENPPVNKMVDYDHFRGYVHSRTLRWSYGAMKNRDGDLWQRLVATMPLEEFVQTLCFADFSGIYIDRNGYEDTGTAMLAELSNLLHAQPLISANGRLAFFSLVDYTRQLHEKYPGNEWEAKHDTSLYPLMVDWTGGFSGFEVNTEKNWRWCSSEGELRFRNGSQQTRKVYLEMSFASGYPQFDDLILSGLISERLKTNASPAPYSKTITVPPGESVIKFTSTGKPINAPLDPRTLVFRVENFTMRIIE